MALIATRSLPINVRNFSSSLATPLADAALVVTSKVDPFAKSMQCDCSLVLAPRRDDGELRNSSLPFSEELVNKSAQIP